MADFPYESLFGRHEQITEKPTLSQLREKKTEVHRALKEGEDVDLLRDDHEANAQAALPALDLDEAIKSNRKYKNIKARYDFDLTKKVDKDTALSRLRAGRTEVIDEILRENQLPELTFSGVLLKKQKEALQSQKDLEALEFFNDSAVKGIASDLISGLDQLGTDKYEAIGLGASVVGGLAGSVFGGMIGLPLMASGALSIGLGFLGDISPVLLRRNNLKRYREAIGLPYSDEEFEQDLFNYSVASIIGTGLGFGLGAAIRPRQTIRAIGEVSANAVKYAGDTRVGKKLAPVFRDIELHQFTRNTDPAVLAGEEGLKDGFTYTQRYGEYMQTAMDKIQRGEKISPDDFPVTPDEFNLFVEKARRELSRGVREDVDAARLKEFVESVPEKSAEEIKLEKKVRARAAQADVDLQKRFGADFEAFERSKGVKNQAGEIVRTDTLSDGTPVTLTTRDIDGKKQFDLALEGKSVGSYKKKKDAITKAKELDLDVIKKAHPDENASPAPHIDDVAAVVPKKAGPEALFAKAEAKANLKKSLKNNVVEADLPDGTRAKITKMADDEFDLQIDGESVGSFESQPQAAEAALKGGETRTLFEYESEINPSLAPIANQELKEFVDQVTESAKYGEYIETNIRNLEELYPDLKLDVEGTEMAIKEALERIDKEHTSAIEAGTTCGIGVRA